jgi:predicted small lipoprotein YifL
VSRLALIALLASTLGCGDKGGALPAQMPEPRPAAETDGVEVERADKRSKAGRPSVDPKGFVGRWTPDMARFTSQPAFAELDATAQAAAIAMVEDVSFQFGENGEMRVRLSGIARVGQYTVVSTSPTTVHLQTRTGDGAREQTEDLHLTLDGERDDWMRIRTASSSLELKRARQ